jgi:hypothetical protein
LISSAIFFTVCGHRFRTVSAAMLPSVLVHTWGADFRLFGSPTRIVMLDLEVKENELGLPMCVSHCQQVDVDVLTA